MKTTLSVTEGAAKIEAVVEAVDIKDHNSGIAVKAAKMLSKDKTFNLAAYLKWDMCPVSGATDDDWIYTAELCMKVLGV